MEQQQNFGIPTSIPLNPLPGIVIDPNTYTMDTYLALVRKMHQATSTDFDQETFK